MREKTHKSQTTLMLEAVAQGKLQKPEFAPQEKHFDYPDESR
jgi:hypothetical protein